MEATLVENYSVDAEHEIAEPTHTFCLENVSNNDAPPITGAGTLRDDLHQPLADSLGRMVIPCSRSDFCRLQPLESPMVCGLDNHKTSEPA